MTWLGSNEMHPLSRPHWLWVFCFGSSAGRYQDRLYYQSTYISTGRQRYISHVLMPWWDRYITDCKCPSIDHVLLGWYIGRPCLVVHALSTTYSINNPAYNRVVLWQIYWFTYMMMYHIGVVLNSQDIRIIMMAPSHETFFTSLTFCEGNILVIGDIHWIIFEIICYLSFCSLFFWLICHSKCGFISLFKFSPVSNSI